MPRAPPIGSNVTLLKVQSVITGSRPSKIKRQFVNVHLLGAASMMAAHTGGADGLDVAAWLLEALVEARLAVGSLASEVSQ